MLTSAKWGRVFVAESPSIEVGPGDNFDVIVRHEMTELVYAFARAIQRGDDDLEKLENEYNMTFTTEQSGKNVRIVLKVYIV